jgi:hypothetical protein
MPKVPVTCQECGKMFEVYPSRSKRGVVKYCSQTCYSKAQSKKNTGVNNPSWKGGKITKVCEECGKEFEKFPAIIKSGGGRYCSIECKGKAASKKYIGEKSHFWKGGKITRICKACGIEFKKSPSDTKNGKGQYCSKACMIKALSAYETRICEECRKEYKTKESTQKYCSRMCMGKAQSKIYLGENHPNWRGGVSFEPYCPKFNNEFKERVRTFFNNVCILCGRTEQENRRKLTVHHVNYKKEACCDEDIPRYFVILCTSCHGKTNSAKGREKYQKQFAKIIENRFGGKSYFHKKEQLSHYGIY